MTEELRLNLKLRAKKEAGFVCNMVPWRHCRRGGEREIWWRWGISVWCRHPGAMELTD